MMDKKLAEAEARDHDEIWQEETNICPSRPACCSLVFGICVLVIIGIGTYAFTYY